MASELDEQKKLLLPILQRAEEIQQVEPKVAYYCRLYALEQGLKIPKRAKEIDGLIMSMLSKLEKDKRALQLDAANDPAVCEQFAIDIFNRADRVDRAGRADAATAKAYYAASVFFDICNQFGEVPADIEEKQRYALWRAAEIRKAIREGRPPAAPAGAEPLPMAGEFADSGVPAAPADPTDALPFASASGAGPSGGVGGMASGGDGLPGLPDTPASGSSGGYPTMPSLPSAPTTTYDYPSPPAVGPVSSGPRFSPGDHVLYCPDGEPPVQQGTVGKVEAGPSGARYKVALPSHIVDASDSELALDASYGTPVLCRGTGPNDGPATVLACNTTSWPPRYLLRNDAGTTFDAAAHQVVAPSAHSADAPAPAEPSYPAQPPSVPSLPTYPSYPSEPASAPPPSYPHASPPSSHPTPPSYSVPPPPAPSHPTPPPTAAPSYPSAPPPRAPAPAPTPAPTPAAPVPFQGQAVAGNPSLADINEAQKMAKYAASSLAFEDVPSAVKYLSDALRLLTHP